MNASIYERIADPCGKTTNYGGINSGIDDNLMPHYLFKLTREPFLVFIIQGHGSDNIGMLNAVMGIEQSSVLLGNGTRDL